MCLCPNTYGPKSRREETSPTSSSLSCVFLSDGVVSRTTVGAGELLTAVSAAPNLWPHPTALH